MYTMQLSYVLHLIFATPYTPHIFTISLLSTLIGLPFLSLIPIRPSFLVGSLAPFILSHPGIQRTFTQLLPTLPLHRWRERLARPVDDGKLKDGHWQSEQREWSYSRIDSSSMVCSQVAPPRAAAVT
jgi:hypothetical protein